MHLLAKQDDVAFPVFLLSLRRPMGPPAPPPSPHDPPCANSESLKKAFDAVPISSLSLTGSIQHWKEAG